jgi:HD superfamily phosphohydrolase
MTKAINGGGIAPQPLIRDAVHGPIDASDTTDYPSPVLNRLIQSRPLQRLRRIKQLGFASQSYVAADHSRYAHSIGTMHVMRKLLDQVGGPHSALVATLTREYAEVYEAESPSSTEILYEHLLVAALLQDLGELPYQNATRDFFLPDDDLREWVGSKIEQDVSLWPAKPVFTLACMYEDEIQEILEQLNIHFVAFLTTAEYWRDEWRMRFRPLQHMLDGEIDADRLDYVHRDAQHTIGVLGKSGDVISAIVSYDELGPICADPAQLGNFLAIRAHLYSSVYFAPHNRFRVMLLKCILQGVRESPAADQFPVLATRYISTESFLQLDDVSLEAEITALARGPLRARTSKRTSIALSEFTTSSNSYEHFWLRENNHSSENKRVPNPLSVPQDVFFEVFEPGTPNESGIRFAIPTPSGETEIVGINEVNGPYFEVATSSRAMLPILGDLLVFYPRNGRGRDLSLMKQAFRDKTLRAALMTKAHGEWDGLPADSRKIPGFGGPSIFISYCMDDITTVRRLVKELHRRRRRYYAIIEPNQGIGGTTAQNSINGVLLTDAAIVVASRSYQDRCQTQLNGNIMHEIRTMHDRRIHESSAYPVVPVSVHPYREVANVPWALLGMDAPPFTGTVLENATDSDLSATIEAVLEKIDSDWTAEDNGSSR